MSQQNHSIFPWGVEVLFTSHSSKRQIGEGTQIGEHAVIQDHVIVGRNCTIMSHALIHPYTIIGDNCVIGHAARIGSGTILANRNFDQREITVRIDGKRVPCGSDFLGAVVGDYARIGANSTTQPGTLIGSHAWIFPSTTVWEFVPRDKTVRNDKALIFSDHDRVYLSD